MTHQISRHRHEPKRRLGTVRDKTFLTPRMLRIVFEGEDFADFPSLAPDDHVKLFLPAGGDEPERRDYTPRRFDRAARTLTIDFALHDAGAATDWARGAQPGDTVHIGGPRGSAVISPTFAWYLLVGDEAALPAIGRRLEELPGTRAIAVAAVTGPEEEQDLTADPAHRVVWVHRPEARDDEAEPLLAALRSLDLPAGDGFVWIAAETKVARAVRDHVRHELRHPPEWIKAAGYWLKGVADAHEKIRD